MNFVLVLSDPRSFFQMSKNFERNRFMFRKANAKNSCHTQSGLLLHLTQVGLAVGDIDSIQQNATLKRLAMQVEFVAEIEESYPRFITRRVYHPSLVVKPNRPTRWKRYHSMWICPVQSVTVKKIALRIFCMPCIFEIEKRSRLRNVLPLISSPARVALNSKEWHDMMRGL